MGFNIFLSIFLILQFFFIFVMSVGMAAKIIEIEKMVKATIERLNAQTDISQIQSNFLESLLKSTLMAQREAATENVKAKKKKES